MKKLTERKSPKVKLVSYTKDPVETIASIWWAAKSSEPVPSIEEIKLKAQKSEKYQNEIDNLFFEIIEMLLPCSRFVNFVFTLENIPISLREQLVRHKVGMEFWIQGARVTDMSKFCEENNYRIPENIQKSPKALEIFMKTMQQTQEGYSYLIENGFLFEEARELLPSGSLHRLSFAANIESLHNLISKRTGWLLQGDLWFPIIKGIIEELVKNVSPTFRSFAHPPEVNMKGEYLGYKFKELSYERYIGITKLPVDPIFYYKEKKYIEERSGSPIKSISQLKKEGLWDQKRVDEYIEFWGFDPKDL